MKTTTNHGGVGQGTNREPQKRNFGQQNNRRNDERRKGVYRTRPTKTEEAEGSEMEGTENNNEGGYKGEHQKNRDGKRKRVKRMSENRRTEVYVFNVTSTGGKITYVPSELRSFTYAFNKNSAQCEVVV